MSDLNREQLRKALLAMGEQAPTTWTKVELKLRLQELTGEDMSKTSRQLGRAEESEYQRWYKKLRKAMGKRKADLCSFVETELGLTNVDNFSVSRLEIVALQRIMEISKPDGSDPLGFGKHSTETYQQVHAKDPGYCKWVCQTAAENGQTSDPVCVALPSGWRLKVKRS